MLALPVQPWQYENCTCWISVCCSAFDKCKVTAHSTSKLQPSLGSEIRLLLQNADGSGYSQWQNAMQEFATHQTLLNVSSYLQARQSSHLLTCHDDSVLQWSGRTARKPQHEASAHPRMLQCTTRTSVCCLSMVQCPSKLNNTGLTLTPRVQVWNEPDLTTYFDYSSTGTAFFAGNSEDYTQMYAATDAGLRVSLSAES